MKSGLAILQPPTPNPPMTSQEIASNAVRAIRDYVLPRRHGHDTRLRRAQELADVCELYLYAYDMRCALARCREALWRFRLSGIAYLDRYNLGRATEEDYAVFRQAYIDTFGGFARELAPYGRFLAKASEWRDLMVHVETHIAWALDLARWTSETMEVPPLPFFA